MRCESGCRGPGDVERAQDLRVHGGAHGFGSDVKEPPARTGPGAADDMMNGAESGHETLERREVCRVGDLAA